MLRHRDAQAAAGRSPVRRAGSGLSGSDQGGLWDKSGFGLNTESNTKAFRVDSVKTLYLDLHF